MAIKIVANLACSFIGTIAYAVMFQVPRRFYTGFLSGNFEICKDRW